MAGNKLTRVALTIVDLLHRQPDLRPTEIARKLGEHDSTVMRALPLTDTSGARLAEDDYGRLSIAEQDG